MAARYLLTYLCLRYARALGFPRVFRALPLLARSAWFEELQPTFVALAEEAGLTLRAVHKVDAHLSGEGGASGGGTAIAAPQAAGLPSSVPTFPASCEKREQEPPAVLEFAWSPSQVASA